jgi:hypothetical protein
MAFVRTSNNPADWIDIGYACGRVSTHGGRMVGGALVVAPPKPLLSKGSQPAPIIPRPSGVPRCGLPMKGIAAGLFCGRRAGHNYHCKSAAVVARENARRRHGE